MWVDFSLVITMENARAESDSFLFECFAQIGDIFNALRRDDHVGDDITSGLSEYIDMCQEFLKRDLFGVKRTVERRFLKVDSVEVSLWIDGVVGEKLTDSDIGNAVDVESAFCRPGIEKNFPIKIDPD